MGASAAFDMIPQYIRKGVIFVLLYEMSGIIYFFVSVEVEGKF